MARRLVYYYQMIQKNTVIVNGLAAAYRTDGSGPAVLLLHGWGSSLDAFEGIARELAADYQVVRVDLPGFGGSEMPKSDWYIQDYAEWVQAFLQKVGVAELHAVMGHSFGGRISIKAVSHGLFMAQKLVLMGSAGVRQSQTARNRAYKAIAKIGKAITAIPPLTVLQPRLKKALYKSAGATDYLNAGAMKQIFLNTINEDLQADARAITTPALLVWGENDTETPPAQGVQLASCIQGSQLKVLPAAGHYVFIDAQPQVMQLLKQFL